MKTVRFATLVQKCGKPEHPLAWAGAEGDAHLKKAARETRLLTVQQELRGSKKDHGVVGLAPGRNNQFFIFPHSLKPFAGARVVGIDYSLAGETLAPALFQPARGLGAPRRMRQRGAGPAPAGLIAFPRPQPESAANHAAAEPASQAEIRRELAAAVRELKRRKVGAARRRLETLQRRIGG